MEEEAMAQKAKRKLQLWSFKSGKGHFLLMMKVQQRRCRMITKDPTREEESVVVWHRPSLRNASRSFPRAAFASVSTGRDGGSVSAVRKGEKEKVDAWERATFSSTEKLLRHPLVPLALVLDGVVLFATGAMSGAAAKTVICIRRKIERMIRSATSDHASNGGTSDQLSKLREDLNYVKFFPKNERCVYLLVEIMQILLTRGISYAL